MPNLGMVPMLDAETGVMQIVDTSSKPFGLIMKNIMNNWIILKILLVSRVPVLWIQELTKVM
jgi:hypothetical protein